MSNWQKDLKYLAKPFFLPFLGEFSRQPPWHHLGQLSCSCFRAKATPWSWEEALSKLSPFKHFHYFTTSSVQCPRHWETSAVLRQAVSGALKARHTQHSISCAAPTSAELLQHQTNQSNTLSLTGLVATNSWLLATAVSEIIVTTELQTKEKNRFLCRVILWQLKLLEKRNKNKWVHGRTAMCTWGQLWHFEKLLILLTSLTSTLSSGPEQI